MTGVWSRTPIGEPARRWSTVRHSRTVLFVVHTVASANRLLDVLPLFDSDFRVRVVFTCPHGSTLSVGVEDFLREYELPSVSWDQALDSAWDLAITANTSGNLHDLTAPLIVLSHGIGYSKTIPGKPESRKAGKPESRKAGKPESPGVYGLSPHSLISDGRVVPDALVLSHDEQAVRLAESVPEAVGAAFLGGDPRFDRMIASRGRRARYRRALGVRDGEALAVVSSTWRSESLFGTWPDLLRTLLAELPVDRYRVAAILHPHIWYRYGLKQIRLWLADCLRAGLILIPPAEGWAAALVAADVVIGDHGAVTGYGAALDKPVLLASFPEEEVAPGTAVRLLGSTAPALRRDRSLLTQLDQARERYESGTHRDIRAFVTSVPGEAAERLRRLCYELLDLPEPETPVLVPLLPLPVAIPGTGQHLGVRVAGAVIGDEVHLARHPVDALLGRATPRPMLDDAHLVAVADHPMPAVRGNADIVFTRDVFTRDGDPTWLAEAHDAHPFARMAAVVLDEARCVVSVRGGPILRIGRESGAVEALAAVSALYLWLTEHDEPPDTLTVRAGDASVFSVRR
ncbi:hypothetical protein [Actinokineospora enzanensis]|uniref:hypothetical protein n=1 Tax=Actinokineospora enzanensis TaxID=155975 RepID=UPI00036904EB|nr:hypothetical protein [Actinokineospora enzanensis]